MKVMKLALLGTAALVAASVGARADNLSDLKAQIKALNARVATLETSPSIPAGYQMVSFSKGTMIQIPGLDTGAPVAGHVIAIMPTADAPAASTVVTWNGYVRVGFLTTRFGATGDVDYDITARAGLTVAGKTDTAVGEVGAKLTYRADSENSDSFNTNNYVKSDGYWGWWKMTPNVTLGGGVDGSLAKSGQGWDALCRTAEASCFGGISNNPGGDPAQIRLSYADGPIGVALGVEDTANNSVGVAAKASYSADMFTADVQGGWWSRGDGFSGPEDAWSASLGLGASLGIAKLSGAVGFGSGHAVGDDFTKASGIVSMNLGDTAVVELGVGHEWFTSAGASGSDFTTFGGGIYYTPVSQLTIGAEASFVSGGNGVLGSLDQSYTAGLFTKFSF